MLPTGKIGKVAFKEPLSAKLIQIIEVAENQYVFLKKGAGIVLYNAATNAVTNIEDDNFSGTVALLVNKNDLLFLKPDGVYTLKIKNLLNKKYKTQQLLKLSDGATMQYNVSKTNLLIADNSIGVINFKYDVIYTPTDTFKLQRANNSHFTKIIADRFQNIYVSSTDDGFFKINGNNKLITNFTIKNGLTSNAIQSLFIDREDNLWVGTYGFGLQQLNNEMYRYRFFKDNDGLPLSVNAIVKFNSKKVVATKKGIGFVSDDKINFVTNTLIANKNFKNLILYKHQFIFSTPDGELYSADTLFTKIEKIKLFTTNQKLVINALCFDEDNIYACTSAGLYVINPTNYQYKVLNTESGLMHNNIKFVFADSKKHLWICSQGSLIYYIDNLKDIKIFDDVKGLKNFNIQTICEDKNNNIWISSLGDGVFKYNGKTFQNFTVQDGLKSAYSYAIKADYKNGIWVVHNNAISYKNNNKKNFNRIGGNSELLQNNFIENAIYYDKIENELFFGTTEGLLKVNTSKQKFNEVEPKLNFLSISINGDRILSFNDTTLKYNAYDVTIDFIGICLSEPQNVKYKYQLKSDDTKEDNWEIISAETRKLIFPKLKNGNYTFIIYACNNDGLWTSQPLQYKFKIDKPLWQKLWFIITCVLSLGIITFLVIRARTKKLIKNQKELEHKIFLQTIEIREEKEHIVQMNEELKTLHDDLRDSINYAKNIQSSIIPTLQNNLGNVTVFEHFQPKDVVGGDFYGYYPLPDGSKIVFIADCTGHGVPGGFLTVIAKALLDKIVLEMKIYQPQQIIYTLNKEFRQFFGGNAHSEEVRYEGLVISLCHINYQTKIASVCVAGNPFYYTTINNDIVVFKGSRSSVGYEENMGDLEVLELQIEPDLRLYLFSDGLQDQFGGDDGKRFSSKKIASVLNTSKHLPAPVQGAVVLNQWTLWKGAAEQVDDVSLIILQF